MDFQRFQSVMEDPSHRLRAEVTLNLMQAEVKELNVSKGWFDEDRTPGDMVALLHSEVSEILEAYRRWKFAKATRGNPPGFEAAIPKPEGVGPEMADVFIRLLDMAERWEIDLVAEYVDKMKYNWTREYRHGGRSL